MGRYVLQRLLHTLIVLIGVSLMTFLLIHLTPGDPVLVMLGTDATPAELDRLRHLLGLDQPKVSALVRGRVEGYSIDRLFRILNALGQQIEISVRPNTCNAHTGAVVVV